MAKGNVCVIPARGGSKRIPKKNIIDFFGKPLIAWTIEAAIKSQCFEKIIVSTDSQEIADISKKYGAEVPFLRQDKNDDVAPVSEATVSTLRQLKEVSGVEFKNVVQLMPNCPLRGERDIKNSFENFVSRQIAFQLSSFKFGWMNPWWSFKLSETNKPLPLFPEELKARSQDLPDLFCPTGAIWIAKVEALNKSNSFYGPDYEFCQIHWTAALDIDDYEDLEMARSVFIQKNTKL